MQLEQYMVSQVNLYVQGHQSIHYNNFCVLMIIGIKPTPTSSIHPGTAAQPAGPRWKEDIRPGNDHTIL